MSIKSKIAIFGDIYDLHIIRRSFLLYGLFEYIENSKEYFCWRRTTKKIL